MTLRSFSGFRSPLGAALGLVVLSAMTYGQEAAAQPNVSTVQKTAPDNAADQIPGKRIFGIVPNFRSSPSLKNYEPISAKEKFKIATLDSFDRGTVLLAGAFAGEGQLSNSSPSLGQGVKGYARYFGTSYADFVIGDYMTEAIYPTFLHQDPRYFRRGTGNGLSRLGYAVAQIFWTHNDSGTTSFNYSEVLGNATAVAISTSYYPESRDAADGISKLGTQLAVDMASNVLKEFWPDMERKMRRKHRDDRQTPGF